MTSVVSNAGQDVSVATVMSVSTVMAVLSLVGPSLLLEFLSR